MQEPITLDQLHILETVARTGSFSAAGRALNRAQSSVSYSIQNLERLLDLDLFDRSGRSPVLTPEGRALLADARQVNARVDQLLARARQARHGVEVELSLAVDGLYPLSRLVPLLQAFRAEFPTVSLRVSADALGGVIERVLSGDAGLAIYVDFDRDHGALDRQAVTSIEMRPVAGANHPLAHLQNAGGIPLGEAALHTQIVVTDRTDHTAGVDHGVLGTHSWRVGDMHTKLAFLRAGFGWGNMPAEMVRDDLANGVLVTLEPPEIPRGRVYAQLFATWLKTEPPGPAARWLINGFGAAPPTDLRSSEG